MQARSRVCWQAVCAGFGHTDLRPVTSPIVNKLRTFLQLQNNTPFGTTQLEFPHLIVSSRNEKSILTRNLIPTYSDVSDNAFQYAGADISCSRSKLYTVFVKSSVISSRVSLLRRAVLSLVPQPLLKWQGENKRIAFSKCLSKVEKAMFGFSSSKFGVFPMILVSLLKFPSDFPCFERFLF